MKNINQTNTENKKRNLTRQSHFVGGVICAMAVGLGHFFNPSYFYLAALPAFGLILDAISGVCLMAMLLKLAPWNRGKTSSLSCCD